MSADETGVKRGGRPRRGEIHQLDRSLLKAAQDVFLTKGYANATITQIAAVARASKRTIYARHPTKAALFEAAISAFVNTQYAPLEDLPLDQGTLRDKLLRLAESLLAIAADQETIAMHRVVAAEQLQFPALIDRLRRYGSDRAIQLLLSILEHHRVQSAHVVAEIFYATFVLAPLQDSSVFLGPADTRIDFFMRGLGEEHVP